MWALCRIKEMNTTIMDKKIAKGLIGHIIIETREELNRLEKISVEYDSSVLNKNFNQQLKQLSDNINWLGVSNYFKNNPNDQSLDIYQFSETLTGTFPRDQYDALIAINKRKIRRDSRMNDIKGIILFNLSLSLLEDFIDDCYDILVQVFPNCNQLPNYKNPRNYVGTFFEKTRDKFLNNLDIDLNIQREIELKGNFFKEVRNMHEHSGGKITSKLIEHVNNLKSEMNGNTDIEGLETLIEGYYFDLVKDSLIDKLFDTINVYVSVCYDSINTKLN